MAMTNRMIVLLKSIELMEQGIIKGSGEFQEMEINGEVKRYEIPEEINTYKRWQEMGYQVNKGEKSFIKFQIWNYSKGKKNETADSTETNRNQGGKCYMKMAAFFTRSQVHVMEAE